MGILGLCFGGFLLYLAVRKVDPEEVSRVLLDINPAWIIGAWFFYIASITMRVLRWHLLLRELEPGVTVPRVAETLIVGFAVNYVLPARLGEVFRADYAKRRMQISRSSALGSIIVERLLDGLIVAGLLWTGLGFFGRDRGFSEASPFVRIAVTASGLICVVVILILLLISLRQSRQRLPAWIQSRLGGLAEGIASLRKGPTLVVVIVSAGVWLLETLGLWSVCRSVGLALSAGQVILLMGAATLSTLVPTAPAFLGSYQYVFVVAMAAFRMPESAGIVAATTIQVVFFGTVTIVGLALMIFRAASTLRRV